MATVVVRFYGRFVIARPRADGKPLSQVNMLAPNMGFNATEHRHFSRHDMLLSIHRHCVESTKTTLKPAMRMMSQNEPTEAEAFVWNLAGFHVAVPKVNDFELTFQEPAHDLEMLEKLCKRTAVLSPSSLQASQDGPVSSVINVRGGVGLARAAFFNRSVYVTRIDAENGKIDSPIGEPTSHADIVEFTLTTADDQETLPFELTNVKQSKPYIITIKLREAIKSGHPVVVSFTNLCAKLPGLEKFDLEFGQNYEILKSSGDDRLIPTIAPRLGEAGDCDEHAHISYDV